MGDRSAFASIFDSAIYHPPESQLTDNLIVRSVVRLGLNDLFYPLLICHVEPSPERRDARRLEPKPNASGHNGRECSIMVDSSKPVNHIA
jgi:hypothetical protein